MIRTPSSFPEQAPVQGTALVTDQASAHGPAPATAPIRGRACSLAYGLGLLLALALSLAPGFIAPLVAQQSGQSGSAASSGPALSQRQDQGLAEVNGAHLAWNAVGQGPPLLLVTGYGATRELWAPDLVARLAERHRVILYDHRGMGGSVAPDTPLTLDLLARDVLGLLDALSLPRADILGWSMGAAVALEAALARPDRVGRLVLYGACAEPEHLNAVVARLSSMTLAEFLAARFPPGWAESHPGEVARIPRPAGASSPEAVAAQRAAMARWPGILDRLPQLSRPALVLAGEADWVCPPGQSVKLAARAPNATLTVLPGGHWLMYQDPEGLARVAGEWLK